MIRELKEIEVCRMRDGMIERRMIEAESMDPAGVAALIRTGMRTIAHSRWTRWTVQ